MLAKSLIYFPSILGVFGIGIFVVLRSRQVAFKLYGIFSFSLAIWLIFQYFLDSQITNGKLWLQIASVALTVMAYSFVLFVCAFPGRKLPPQGWFWTLTLPVIFFLPLSFSNLYLHSLSYSGGDVVIDSGALFDVQTIMLLTYAVIGIGVLISRIKHADSILRSQMNLLIGAFIIGVVGMALSGFVFPTSPYWQLARPFAVLAMLSTIAYAMIRRRLFDIKSYVIRGAVYFVSLGSVTALFVLLAVLPSTYILHTELQTRTVAYLTFVTLAAALLFHPLRVYFNKITNRLFYRDYYDPQDLLDQISSLLVGAVELDEIKNTSKRIIEESIKPNSFQYLLSDDHKNDRVLKQLQHSNLAFVVTDQLDQAKYAALFKLLQKHDIALAARLQTTHEDLGFMTLGSRQSGAMYTAADQRILRAIADELAIGFQNALRFKEIEQFNLTLQEKIEDATRKLRRTNEKLRQLDETKDDFISMASHQLRTPLTSVKGYVSMVIDGDAGPLTPLQKKLLNQSFISAQRMVYLISDLLNVSRLRTGKFVIEPVPTNLANIVAEEVKQLVETAKGRDLELTYHKPEHFPSLMLDETKTRQVIMNFVDNAIYYTPAGGHITINLVDKPQAIELTVVDDGIGVPKAEQHHLFSKFYRANNAKRARPDGTGLGLFMAKKVIIAQGGAIIFKSQEGKGSMFGFTFAKTKELVVPEDKA